MDTSSRAAGASVGVKKAVDDLFAPEPAGAPSDHTAITTARYTEGLKKIEESMASALATIKVNGVDQVLPGATLKIVAASSRSITTAETFIDRPLVIGYLVSTWRSGRTDIRTTYPDARGAGAGRGAGGGVLDGGRADPDRAAAHRTERAGK